MTEVGIREAKARLSELIDRAAGARPRSSPATAGRPAARLMPDSGARRARVRETIELMRRERDARPRVPLEGVLAMRDEGRRF